MIKWDSVYVYGWVSNWCIGLHMCLTSLGWELGFVKRLYLPNITCSLRDFPEFDHSEDPLAASFPETSTLTRPHKKVGFADKLASPLPCALLWSEFSKFDFIYDLLPAVEISKMDPISFRTLSEIYKINIMSDCLTCAVTDVLFT